MTEIFIISLLVSISLVSGKVWEIKTQRRSVFTKVFSKADPFIERLLTFFKTQFAYGKKKIIFSILVDMPTRIERLVVRFRDKAHKKYKNTLLGVRDGSDRVNDQPSAFMRNLSQIDKGNGMLDE